MPVFGKTLFETVLDGMKSEDIDEEEMCPSHGGARTFHAFVYGEPDETPPQGLRSVAFAYEDYLPDSAEVPKNEPPSWIGRLSKAEIAEDLALDKDMTAAQLRDKRRIFARENHPDGVRQDFRNAATRRMTIANQMIDRALSKT